MGQNHGELWRQAEASSSWSQVEGETVRGGGVSGRTPGRNKLSEGPRRKQAFRKRGGRALWLVGTWLEGTESSLASPERVHPDTRSAGFVLGQLFHASIPAYDLGNVSYMLGARVPGL